MQTKNKGFRPDINGLRAIAVIAVVLYHFGVKGFSGGFAGVDIFFVISGFLMTGIIFGRISEDRFSIVEFYIARAKRIIPALAFLCITLMVAGWFLLIPTEYRSLGKHAAASIAFLSNIAYLRESGYFDASSHSKWLLHTWSLSVEWQFYIVYPILILALKRFVGAGLIRPLIAVAAFSSFVLCVSLSYSSPSSSFYLLPTRAWEMLSGALLFLFPTRLTKNIKYIAYFGGLALICISISSFSSDDVWPGWLAIIPVMGASLVILASNSSSRLMSNSAISLIGDASYSIYLWHWPIVVALHYFDLFNNSAYVLIGIILSLGLGYVSLKIIETPARLAKPKTNIHLFYAYFSAIALIAIFSTTVFMKNGLPSRVSEYVLRADNERKNTNPSSVKCSIKTGIESPKCIFGKNNNGVDAIVIGDSHADAIISSVVEAAGPNRSTLYMGYISCMTIPGMLLRGAGSDYKCGDFATKQIQYLETHMPGVPLLIINRTPVYIHGHNEYKETQTTPLMHFGEKHARHSEYMEDLTKRYVSAMCSLSKNRKVFVLTPVPEMSLNVPTLIARKIKKTGNIEDFTISVEQYLERSGDSISLIKEAEKTCGIIILYSQQELCDSKLCYGSVNGIPLYIDDNHLSESGNKRLAPLFRKIWD